MVSPVTVFVADVEEPEVDEELDDELDDELEGDAVVTAATVGACECALKPSVAPRPAAVAARTMGARFMTGLRISKGEGLVVKVGSRDAGLRRGCHDQILERLGAAEVDV